MRRPFLTFAVLLLAFPALATASLAETGRVNEFQLGRGTHAQALVAGPDGNIWFAGINYGPAGVTDILGRVTLRGEVTEFPVGTHAENVGLSDITVGPDGNLWFTEGGRPKIGRVTPGGQVSEFDLPMAGASPQSIVTGSDGNLWFTDEAGGRVGRITPSGTVTEIAHLGGGNRPYGIAAGPDGALWVAVSISSTIARIGTDGTLSEFPLGGQESLPREIIAGPDGALWFGQVRASAVGRIDISGELAQFPALGGDQTYALSNGPSGALWYSNGGGKIGSMTPTGATARPACIRSCRLPIASLAQGPDGKLWFAAGTLPSDPKSARGTVGTFAPPPLEAKILAGAERQGRTVRVQVRCDWGTAGDRCDGSLHLLGRERRFLLPLGAERRLSLRLPSQVLSLLADRGRLIVRATTNVAGGRRDARRIVLRHP